MNREDNIYYARLAEQGERYEDMIKYMKEVAKVNTILLIQIRLVTNLATKREICFQWLIRTLLEQEEQLGAQFQQFRIKRRLK
jgi:14-3-3 protein epsilon